MGPHEISRYLLSNPEPIGHIANRSVLDMYAGSVTTCVVANRNSVSQMGWMGVFKAVRFDPARVIDMLIDLLRSEHPDLRERSLK